MVNAKNVTKNIDFDDNKSFDMRKLSADEQYMLRLRVVKAYVNGEKDIHKLMKIFNVRRYETVSNWIFSYQLKGWDALKNKGIRGKHIKDTSLLKSDQLDKVVSIITTERPNKYNLPGIHWNAKNIGRLILEKFNLKLSTSAITYNLKKKHFYLS